MRRLNKCLERYIWFGYTGFDKINSDVWDKPENFRDPLGWGDSLEAEHGKDDQRFLARIARSSLPDQFCRLIIAW